MTQQISAPEAPHVASRLDWAWRIGPLLAAGVIGVIMFWVPLVLAAAPLTLGFAVTALRRVGGHPLVWLGLILSVLLSAWLVATVVNIFVNGR